MAIAKTGDTVKVHYKGTLVTGEVFDTSTDQDPLEITLGEGNLIRGFEEALIGMETGESKQVTITKEKAYGDRIEDLVVKVERTRFPEDMSFEIGQQLVVSQSNEENPDFPPTIVSVVEYNNDFVTIDANHPLAGQELTFEIQLLEICESE
jgi:peptidylprolyl isomerase